MKKPLLISLLFVAAGVATLVLIVAMWARSVSYPNPDDIEAALRKKPSTINEFFDDLAPSGASHEVDAARHYYAARGDVEIREWREREAKYGFAIERINWLGETKDFGAVREIRNISGQFARDAILSDKPPQAYYLFVGDQGKLLGWVRD